MRSYEPSRRFRTLSLAVGLLWMAAIASLSAAEPDEAAETLGGLIEEALAVETPTRSAEEYRDAAEVYRDVLRRLGEIDEDALSPDLLIDRDLLEAHLETRSFEIEDLRLHELVPVRYFVLSKTDNLFVRPCGVADSGVRDAVEELREFPTLLASAQNNLGQPARVWTDNALYQVYYARLLLTDYVADACVDDPSLESELQRAAGVALAALDDFEAWMKDVLLPRSDRSPAWEP